MYYGYSKVLSRAFVFVKFPERQPSLNYPNINHYWAERFYFVLIDSRYPNFQGQITKVNVNLGPNAFKVSDDYNTDKDVFNYC